MFTKLFWKDAAERALATFAQVFLSVFAVIAPAFASSQGVDLIDGFQAVINSLGLVLAISLFAAFLSVLKAIYAASKNKTESASLVIK